MKMEKNVWRKILLLFCMVLCLTGIFHQNYITKAETEEKKENEQFDMAAETALGNYVKIGRNSRMKVTITNHGGDFNGLVQILTVVHNSNIMYQKAISIGSGETKTLEIPFRMQSGNKNIVVRIADEDEKIFKKIGIKVNISDNYQYFNGILTDNKQGMGYLEDYSTITWLDKDSMPDTAEGIDALDRIYINDFQTAKLSKEQYEVLKTWVEEGGDLVIGTGVNAGTVLSIFQDDFLRGKVGEQTKDGRVELSFEGEKVYQDIKANYGIHSIQIGKGYVWIYDVDLAVTNKEWKEKGARYIEYQLNQQFGTTEFPAIYDENALYVDNELEMRDTDSLPDIFLYSVIFLIYILCVSVGIYIVLKKRDKLEKTWIAVPVFSILFVVVVYMLGSSTRITGPFIMYRGDIRFSGEGDTNPQEKNILQISSPNNKNYTLAIPEGRTIYSEQGDLVFDQMNSIDSYKIGFYQGDERQYVAIKNVSAFEKNTLISEQTRKMGEGYESKIVSDKFQCQGSFTNHTGYTLKYAVLMTENMCYKLGTIKDGETVKINKETPSLLIEDGGNFYRKLEKMLVGTTQSKTIEAMRYTSAFFNQDYGNLRNIINRDNYSGVVCACIDLNEDREKMNMEWGIDCDGITTCKMPVKLDYRYGGDSFVPNLIAEGEDIDNVIDSSDWTFDYSKITSVDVEYTLKQGEVLTGLYYLEAANPSIYQNNKNYFQGEVLAYNYKTMEYEVIFESDKEKSIRKVKDYVNQENTLKIRVKTYKQTEEDSEWEKLPIISLTKQETK